MGYPYGEILFTDEKAQGTDPATHLDNVTLSEENRSQRLRTVGFHVYGRSGIGKSPGTKQVRGSQGPWGWRRKVQSLFMGMRATCGVTKMFQN